MDTINISNEIDDCNVIINSKQKTKKTKKQNNNNKSIEFEANQFSGR